MEEVSYSTEARIADALKEQNTIYSLPPVTEVKIAENLKKKILKDTMYNVRQK